MDSAVQQRNDASNCRCTSAVAVSDEEVVEWLAVIASYTRDIDSYVLVSRCCSASSRHSQSSDPIRYCYRCHLKMMTMESAADLVLRCSSDDGLAEEVAVWLDDEHLPLASLDNADDIQFGSSGVRSCSMAALDSYGRDSVAANSYRNSNESDIQPVAKRI